MKFICRWEAVIDADDITEAVIEAKRLVGIDPVAVEEVDEGE